MNRLFVLFLFGCMMMGTVVAAQDNKTDSMSKEELARLQKRLDDIKDANREVEMAVRKIVLTDEEIPFSNRGTEKSKSKIMLSSPKTLWAYTYVFVAGLGGKEKTAVTHVWYYKNQIASVVPLPVKANKWWTFSKKTILPEQAGEWRVEVRDINKEVIKVHRFTVEREG